MKFFIGIIFIITVFFVQERDCLLKTRSIRAVYFNPRYANEENFQVHVNNTGRYEKIHWNLLVDLPADVTLISEVYILNNAGVRVKRLLDIVIPICVESKFRKALPTFLYMPEDKLNQPCILRNHYYLENVGQLDIELLKSNLAFDGIHFGTDNRIATRDETIVGWYAVLDLLPNFPIFPPHQPPRPTQRPTQLTQRPTQQTQRPSKQTQCPSQPTQSTPQQTTDKQPNSSSQDSSTVKYETNEEIFSHPADIILESQISNCDN